MPKQSVQKANNYAHFRHRFLAFAVDCLVVYLISVLIAVALGWNPLKILQVTSLEETQNLQNQIQITGQKSSFLAYAPFVLLVAYPILLWVHNQGTTLGKKLMGIRLIKTDGSPVTYPTAIIRFLILIPSVALAGLGCFWIIWDKERQGWHDKLAKTKVVKTDQKPKTCLALLFILLVIGAFVALILGIGYKGLQIAQKETWFYRSYEQAVTKMTPEAKTHWDRAQELFNQMRENKEDDQKVTALGQEAITELEKATEIDPDNPRIWSESAKAHSWLGGEENHQKAFAFYQKALDLEPKNVLYSNLLADQFWRMEEYGEAEKQFNHSLQLHPNDGYAYFGLGLAYKGMEEKEKAKENFTRAMEIFGPMNAQGDLNQTIEKIREEMAGLEEQPPPLSK